MFAASVRLEYQIILLSYACWSLQLLKLRKAIRLESLGLPFKKALPVAAELGVEGIEINSRTEVRPAELSRTGVRQVRKMLEDFRLTVSCVNFPSRRGYAALDNLEQRIDATKAAMTMAYDLGCNVVSNRIGPIPPADSGDLPNLIQALEDIGRHGSHVGAVFAARTGDDGGEKLAELIHGLGPGSLSVDFDPAELLMNRFDEQLAMESLSPHVVHFRARDAVRDLSQSENVEVQLGRGSIELPPLLAKLEEHQYAGFINVQCPASNFGRQELAESLEYLDNVFA